MKWHITFHNETIINENDELKNKASFSITIPYDLPQLILYSQANHYNLLPHFFKNLANARQWVTPVNSSQPDYQQKHYSRFDIRQVVFIFFLF